MKKFLTTLLLILLFSTLAWSIPPTSIPPIRSTDCTPFVVDGMLCYNTSTDKFYVGNGTTAIEVVNLSNSVFPAAGIPVYDTNSSHILYLKAGSDITANKNLTFTTGDSDRTITLSGDTTLSGTNTGDVTLAVNHGLALTNQVIGMGTPSSITGASTNAVSTTTHTHAIDLSSPPAIGGTAANTGAFTAIIFKTVTKVNTDSPYTVLSSDFSIICNAASGAIVVNLPSATGSGRVIEIKKIDSSANLVTPTGTGGGLIDGTATITLTAQWEAVTLQDTAANTWHIL